jgi:hypothetical protein
VKPGIYLQGMVMVTLGALSNDGEKVASCCAGCVKLEERIAALEAVIQQQFEKKDVR